MIAQELPGIIEQPEEKRLNVVVGGRPLRCYERAHKNVSLSIQQEEEIIEKDAGEHYENKNEKEK